MKNKNFTILQRAFTLLLFACLSAQVSYAQPANDDCANAEVLTMDGIVSGDNILATADRPGVTCGATDFGSGDVWYTFNDGSGAGSLVTATMCAPGSATFDTKIQVFSGSCGALACVTGNDDFCGLQSEVSFMTDGSSTYYIAVYGFSTAEGNFNLSVSGLPADPPPPPMGCDAIVAPPACNGQGNIQLDAQCFALITPAMALTPAALPCLHIYKLELYYDMALTQPAGTIVPGGVVVGAGQAGVNLFTKVINMNVADGSSWCWGRFLVEDKEPPVIMCQDVTINCTQEFPPIVGISGTATRTVSPGFAIPDAGTEFSSIPIDVSAPASALATEVEVTVNISHTWIGDLVIGIVPPSGNLADGVLLWGQECGFTEDLIVTFDDDAPLQACGNVSGGQTTSLSLDLLSNLDGQLVPGQWTLVIADTAPFDVGTVNSVSLRIEYQTGGVMVTDNCFDITPTLVSESSVDGDCLDGDDFLERITRVWRATDGHNPAVFCTQTITVAIPVVEGITVPPNYDDIDEDALLCDDKDQCGLGQGGWHSIQPGDFVDENGHNLWVGHPSPDSYLYCPGTGRPGGESLCGTMTATFIDIRQNHCESGASEGCYKIIRRWTILDWCTSTVVEHDQIIKVADREGPTFADLEPDVTISVDPWACTATYWVPEPWISDNCSDLLDGPYGVPYHVVSTAGNVAFNTTLQRYVITDIPLGWWTVTYISSDCCENVSEYPVRLHVIDLVPPIAVCDVFHTVSLGIDGQAKVFAWTFDDGSYDDCGPIWYKTIRMEDLLGTDHGSDNNQSATECDIANGDDNPALNKPGNQIYFDDYAKFCCEDIGEDIMVVLRVFDVDPSPYVVPGTDGAINPNAMKQGGALYGHYNDCMVETTVEDKLPPYIDCPTDLSISCDYWLDLDNLDEFGKIVGDAYDRDSIIIYDRAICNNSASLVRKSLGVDGVAFDNCEIDNINETVIDGRICGQGVITRIFTVTDHDGRTASCQQRIYVVDCDPFDIRDERCPIASLSRPGFYTTTDDVRWPCDYETDACGPATDPSVAGEPIIYNEDNCSLVSVDYDDETYTIQADACFKIQREWVIIDWCQFDEDDSDNNEIYEESDNGVVPGKWTYIQYIKVLNSEDPVFETCEDVTLCAYNDDCTGTVELHVSISDDCTTDPDDLVIDYKIDANNDGIYDLVGSNVNPYPYNNPNNLPVRYFPSNDPNADGTYPVGTHRILWNAEDHCGNVGTCQYTFTVEDCKEPTPYCDQDLTIPVMPSSGEVTIWANDWDEGAFDNCTASGDLRWLISREQIGPGASLPPSTYTNVVLDCDDVAQGAISVNVFAIDEAGNWDYCTVSIIIQDQTGVCDGAPQAMIYGTVENEEAEAIEEVEVRLTGNSMSETEMTNVTGEFQFPGLPMDQNYEVEPELNIDPLNGISTFDLVLISKHILNIEALDSPYKMIAADVNNSGSITTLDMVSLRKLILFIDTEFQNNASWRFVDASFVFADPTDPFAAAFPEMLSINGLDTDTQADFVAIKTGDVNGSATPNSIAQASDRNKVGSLVFAVADQRIAKGEEVTIEFKADDFNAMLGYQFSLGFDTDALDFVETTGLNVENFGLALLDQGVITTSWNSKEAVTISDDEVVFAVTFRATDNVNISEVIELNSRYTVAEAYNSSLELMDVAIEFNGKATADFSLYQNQPNPFKDATVIGFNLPEASAATLTVYDVSGRVLKLVEGDFAKGYNQVSLSRSELAGSGILYYQLDTPDDSATRKMIIVD